MALIVVKPTNMHGDNGDALMVMEDRRISVVIAEDSLLIRDSVRRALSTNPDVDVVGEGVDYGEIDRSREWWKK